MYAEFAIMKERHKLRKTELKSTKHKRGNYNFSKIVNSGRNYGSSKLTGYAQASEAPSSSITSPRSVPYKSPKGKADGATSDTVCGQG